MGQFRPLFSVFSSLNHSINIYSFNFSIQIEKSIDAVYGIQTQGCKMVGTDETTELPMVVAPSLHVKARKMYNQL